MYHRQKRFITVALVSSVGSLFGVFLSPDIPSNCLPAKSCSVLGLQFNLFLKAPPSASRQAIVGANQIQPSLFLPAIAQGSPASGTLKTYVVPDKFSIQHPSGWVVENVPDAAPNTLLYIWSRKPSASEGWTVDLVKTDVQTVPGSFQMYVRQSTDNRTGMGRILKSGRTQVGGREAFRIWSINTGGDYNTNAITTIVRYTNTETALIASNYIEKNPTAVAVIQRIHGSFRSLR